MGGGNYFSLSRKTIPGSLGSIVLPIGFRFMENLPGAKGIHSLALDRLAFMCSPLLQRSIHPTVTDGRWNPFDHALYVANNTPQGLESSRPYKAFDFGFLGFFCKFLGFPCCTSNSKRSRPFGACDQQELCKASPQPLRPRAWRAVGRRCLCECKTCA